MTNIKKSEALVLHKLDYGDTSKIAALFTMEYGKVSAIIKGARSRKSKLGNIVDVLNHVEIVFYFKESRNIQLLSQADLIKPFTRIKENLDKLKYSSAILELIDKLTAEGEKNSMLFRGTVRILNLINDTENDIELYFTKYLLFFIKELGYEFQFDKCGICGKKIVKEKSPGYNFEKGFICENCKEDHLNVFEFTSELFNLITCLSSKRNNILYTKNNLNKLIGFFERYLVYHIENFNGLSSLKIY